MKKGCCWRVGDGTSIRVTQDRWIPHYPTNKILHLPMKEEWEWRVTELIDCTTHEWDQGVLDAKFHRNDVEAILQIPLSRRHVPDTIMWLPNKNGAYSVKSGYHMARTISREVRGREESSGVQHKNQIWLRLWNVHSPNKIKIFSWRACQNILPTRENLMRRKIIKDSLCEFC